MYHKLPDLEAAGDLREWVEDKNNHDGQFDHVDTEQSERSSFNISETASIEKPVKRKRGRPRKKPVENVEKDAKDKPTSEWLKTLHANCEKYKGTIDKIVGVDEMAKSKQNKLVEDLIVEKAQLSEKIVKLNTTLVESIDGEISKSQHALLELQLSGMTTYYKALIARIKDLSED